MFSRLYLYNTSQSISEKRINVYSMLLIYGELANGYADRFLDCGVHRVNGTPNLPYNMQ